jgi:hypothetical protein
MGLRDRWWIIDSRQAIELARRHNEQGKQLPWVEPVRASRLMSGGWGVMTDVRIKHWHLFFKVSRDGSKISGGERLEMHNIR